MFYKKILFLLFIAILLASCISINISDPMGKQYNETILQGTAKDKIAVLTITGIINDSPSKGFLKSGPGLLQDFLTQLKLAEYDPDVKAILLKINSPGGTVTSSDILYNEITEFKKRSGKKVLVCMMDVAASGGYYISLAADYIIANPTTITGSVGVIFMRPQISNLANKLGINIEVNKSGKNKDMGSPYREATKEETELFNKLTKSLAERFYYLLNQNRNISEESFEEIKTARILLAEDAKRLGLIDEINYLDSAVLKTMEIAGISRNSRVVAYRPARLYYDNIYNNPGAETETEFQIKLGSISELLNLNTGFYYIWEAALK